MKGEEVEQLASKGIFQDTVLNGRLVETHISWVILTKEYAFKLKKPITLPFLDFSTLSLRKFFCEREVLLNSRFSDIYLDVLPVRIHNNCWYLGGDNGKVIDYVVQMKRLSEAKRMDHVVLKGKVPLPYIDSLAKLIASFHLKAKVITSPFDIVQARRTFNDIAAIRDVVSDELGDSFVQIIDESIRLSNDFLNDHKNRFQERIQSGFKRDLHGDLHSRNIFLYRQPILFDCIEFNDAYRQIDVLYEIAFLCMELEVLGHKELINVFITSYINVFNCFETEEDKLIFNYFKFLRANVRAKVYGLSVRQVPDPENRNTHVEEIRKYLILMKNIKPNN